MSRRPAHLRATVACAAAAIVPAITGCGGERRDASAATGTYSVDVVRAQFPTRQHLAENPSFVLTVRNTGERTIPNLTATVHGFTARRGGAADADPHVPIWLIDAEPAGAVTAVEDTWAAGAVAPGRTVTLRWRVTPVRAGTHAIDYALAPDLAGDASVRSSGATRARGSLRVRVAGAPADARVDPRTGRVIRE